MSRSASLLLTFTFLLGLAGPAHAASPAETCGSTKVKAAAGYVPKRLACSLKAASKGLSLDPACLAAADALLDAKHVPADTAPACVIQRDTAATRASSTTGATPSTPLSAPTATPRGLEVRRRRA